MSSNGDARKKPYRHHFGAGFKLLNDQEKSGIMHLTADGYYFFGEQKWSNILLNDSSWISNVLDKQRLILTSYKLGVEMVKHPGDKITISAKNEKGNKGYKSK